MQLLDSTAQAMAAKLDMPWRPDLMRAKFAEAARYQNALGQAYFEEGLAKTGNYFDAARYYHGGPNRKNWGPKTNDYAADFVARLGGK